MTHTEALKLALEALGKWSSGCDMDAVTLNDLIATLEAALEQPEPPPEAQTEAEKIAYCAGWWAAMAAKAKEQPEQEPVAWMDDFGNAFPLGAVKGAGSWRDDHQRNWTPLFTHPPRREWRSLSEEEIRELTFHNQRTLWPRPDRSDVRATAIPFARTVEQALKERNT